MRPERLFFATFSRPYAIAGAVILVADKPRFPSVATINQAGVRLAVNAGGHLEQVARAHFDQATILAIPKNQDLPAIVEAQQADALLTDSLEAPQFLAAHSRLSALPAFGRDRKAYLLRRSDEQLRDWLNAWLLERERDGFLPDLRQQWLGENQEHAFSPWLHVFALLDLRLALMPAVAAYKHHFSLPLEDREQEARVIEQAAVWARETRQNPEALQELFRIQIDLAKQVQRFMITHPERIPQWARGRQLEGELRPALSSLGLQISNALAAAAAFAPSQDAILQWAEAELVTEGVTPEEKQRLGQAVWRVTTSQTP